MFNGKKLMIGIMMIMLMAFVPVVFGDMLPVYNEDSCIESDGLNYNVKGFAKGPDENTGVFGQYYDSCGTNLGDKGKQKGAYIAETHCSGTETNKYVHTQWYECENGCFNGACLKDKQCTDTDNGENIYQKGTITGHWGCTEEGNPIKEYADYCLDADTVFEYLCNNPTGCNNILAVEKDCPSSYRCSDGACVVANPVISSEGMPDLTIASLNYDTNNYRAKVCNVGNKPVSNFKIKFAANSVKNDLFYVPTITPRNCVDIYSWAYSYFGVNADNVHSYYVNVYLDPDNNINEKSESNNFFGKVATNVPIEVEEVNQVGITEEENQVEITEEVNNIDWYEHFKNKLQYGECEDPDGGFNPKVKGWAYGYNVWNEGYLSWGDYCTATPDGAQVNEGGAYLHEAVCMTVQNGQLEVRYQDPIKCKYGCDNGICLGDGSFDFIDSYDYQELIEEIDYSDYPIPRPSEIDYSDYPIPHPSEIDYSDYPIPRPSDSDCNGCTYDGKCLPIGTKKVNGKALFCDIDGTFKTQKTDGAYCDNSFECKSNFCSNSKCIDLEGELKETNSMLKRILAWLDKLF